MGPWRIGGGEAHQRNARRCHWPFGCAWCRGLTRNGAGRLSSARQGPPQRRRARLDHLADRHGTAPAPVAEGPEIWPGVRHRAESTGAAPRGRPGRARPRQAVIPAGRGAVLRDLRRSYDAPAPALRAHPRRRGRHRDADADGTFRSRPCGRWPSTRGCRPRRSPGTRPSATRRGGGNPRIYTPVDALHRWPGQGTICDRRAARLPRRIESVPAMMAG